MSKTTDYWISKRYRAISELVDLNKISCVVPLKMKPFDINCHNYHMGHLFLDTMRSRPDAICQIDAATDESETNASVLRRSVQLARCLRRFGTRPGDVISLVGWNHLDIHIPYYAAFLNGLTVTGVNFDAYLMQVGRWCGKIEEIKIHFKSCTPRLAFCQKEHLEKYLHVVKELELNTKVICFDAGDYSLKRFIQEYEDGGNDDEELEPLIFNLDKVYVAMLPSSGTSRIYKMATFKHRTIINKILDLQNNCTFYRKNFGDKFNGESKLWLLLSQVGWVSSLLRALLIPVMQYTKLMTSAMFTTEHVIDVINKYRPSTTVTRVGILKAIFKSEKSCDFTCFDSLLVSGDKTSKAFHLELRKRMRSDAVECEGYGHTENLGPMLLVNPEGPVGNCGNRPYKGQRIKLMHPETGKEIKESNVVGEMWMKNICFSEYYKNPKLTAAAFTEDGWYKTGDLLYRNQDGNYFFAERLKNVIRYRNKPILPSDLEIVMRTHPEVSEVVVMAIPHEEDGEHPVACVVKKQNSAVTAQQIKDFVDSKLPESYKLRGGVIFLKQLPYLWAGKLAQYDLNRIVLTSSCRE